MLRGLGRAEVDDIVAERGQVEVGCEFCGQHYQFDPVDVGELFTPTADHPPGSSVMN
jgi:molecular chaperone Hsp33